jgi:hypothetical protein
VNRLRAKWPDVEIIIRADAGFAVPRILDWCDENDVDYIIGYVKNQKLDRRISRHLDRARLASEKSGQSERVYTSCHEFRANQMRLVLSAAAYVLVAHVRRVGLRGTTMARAQAWIIRARLFKVATRVVVSVRRVRLKLSETWPYADILTRALRNLTHRGHRPRVARPVSVPVEPVTTLGEGAGIDH